MRAFSWVALACLAVACGGSAFSESDPSGDGGSSNRAGSSGKAGQGSGGSAVGNGGAVIGSGGKVSSGGKANGGGVGLGGLGIAGDLVAGGSFPVAGEPGVAGSGPYPIIDEACPAEVPDGSHPCVAGLTCSYGSDVRSACRTRAVCDSGKWSVSEVDCVALKPCDNIIQGDKCDANATPGCTIDGYIYCACTGCGAGGPCSTDTVWKCAAGSGGAACPKLAPNEGQPCNGEPKCPYGSCATDGPVTATCLNATWAWEYGVCAL